jgi:hypothetical protein
LQIDQLRDIRVREDVMTAADTPQLEAQRLGESAKVTERRLAISPRASRARSLRSFMIETVVTAWDGLLGQPWSKRPRHPELQTDHYLDGYRIGVIEQP